MSKIKWTSLALLLIVILDASGDAFRLQGWQVAHHVMEALQIAGWLFIWFTFRFNPVWIVMYLLHCAAPSFYRRPIDFQLHRQFYRKVDWHIAHSNLYG